MVHVNAKPLFVRRHFKRLHEISSPDTHPETNSATCTTTACLFPPSPSLASPLTPPPNFQQIAQKTDANQLCRTLLVSDKARVTVMPSMEIIANDVKCTHGATICDLEDEELFYLMSRGISKIAVSFAFAFSFSFAELLLRTVQ